MQYRCSRFKWRNVRLLLKFCYNLFRPLFYLSYMKANEKEGVTICNLLLDSQAKPNILNRQGITALSKAIQHQKWDIVDVLLYKTDINLGKSALPLHYAIKSKHLKTIRALLTMGTKVDVQTSEGLSALDLAVLTNDKEIITVCIYDEQLS
jgi:ankyrin repeat protein